MNYQDFRDAIRGRLQGTAEGLTWAELREELRLPYERACPEWARQLEGEIGLVRRKEGGRILRWGLEAAQTSGSKPR